MLNIFHQLNFSNKYEFKSISTVNSSGILYVILKYTMIYGVLNNNKPGAGSLVRLSILQSCCNTIIFLKTSASDFTLETVSYNRESYISF